MPPKRATRAASSRVTKTTTINEANTSKKVSAATKKVSKTSTTTKKAAPAKSSKAGSSNAKASKPKATSAASKKRKADEEESESVPAPKKPRVTKPRAPKPAPKPKPKVVINQAPTARLNVYVCGEGGSGELGLGAAKNAVDVKRPRLNPNLSADQVGVVQVAVGGMHCVALTHDNKVLTWGVNDQGALGRNTAWEGGYKDIDANKDDEDTDDDDDPALNPFESTPTAIPSDTFPEGTVIVEVAAGDSSSFALTDDGLVYGWGTFRVSSFSYNLDVQANLCRAMMASWDLMRLTKFSSLRC